jgi:hypothetical protein
MYGAIQRYSQLDDMNRPGVGHVVVHFGATISRFSGVSHENA